MSSEEFTEWMIVFKNGWLDADEEYRAAMVASVIANTARDERKRKTPFQPVDFMRPHYIPKTQEQNLSGKIQRIFSLFGIVKEGENGGTG